MKRLEVKEYYTIEELRREIRKTKEIQKTLQISIDT